MNRKLVVVALVSAGAAVASMIVWRHIARRPEAPASRSVGVPPTRADDAALARLDAIPLYRLVVRAHALRAGWVDGDGALHVEIDLRAALEPRLSALGFAGASTLLPELATGTIVSERTADAPAAIGLRESWSVEGPAAALDLLDRNPVGPSAAIALDAIPGSPSAMARVRLAPSRLADPRFGGAALASWRDRVTFVENLLGRPLRQELAEDLAGPAVFALYEDPDDDEPDAVVVTELRRSDRMASLLDMVFGLGALTERATVTRYRGVPTGSFGPTAGGTGLALAVDGPVLIVATSRARLESAIDARRAGTHSRPTIATASDGGASWTAVSTSAFVRHGWDRLARSSDETADAPTTTAIASLWPEGANGWRLDGRGPGPAITADPVLPFLRGVLERRQRGSD
jgi:hypothetical protein